MPHTHPDAGTRAPRRFGAPLVVHVTRDGQPALRVWHGSGTGTPDPGAIAVLGSQPGWLHARTAEALADLRGGDRLIGACRDVEPSVLDWVATQLGAVAGRSVLHFGVGLGGASAWLARSTGAAFVGVDDDGAALAGLRLLFPGQPAVRARIDALPFRDGSVDHAVAIGVLDRAVSLRGVARSIARVLRPGGRFVAVFHVADGSATSAGLLRLRPATDHLHPFHESGFDQVALEALEFGAPPPEPWRRIGAAVDDALRARHGDDLRLRSAMAQRRALERLVSTGRVSLRGLTATRAA